MKTVDAHTPGVMARTQLARQCDAIVEAAEAASPRPPPGAAERIWIVVRPSGERLHVENEPPEGILEWARGIDSTVLEYQFAGVIHRPPPKPPAKQKEPPKPKGPIDAT